MKRTFLLFTLIIITASCNLFTHQVYRRIAPGLYFRLISLGEGGSKANAGDFVTMDLRYTTAEDSVFFRGTRKWLLKESPFPGSVNEAFLRLSTGDSASVFVSASAFFEKTLHRKLPAYLDKNDEIRIDMRLREVQSREAFEREKKMFLSWINEIHASETGLIEQFIQEQQLDVRLADQGYYYVRLRKGAGKKVEKGRHIYINYEGRFLNGKYFDSTVKRKDPVDFIYGSEYIVLKGIDEALSRMREGEKALVILPSDLAYGPEGSGGGIVPPYTALVYEVDVLKVE